MVTLRRIALAVLVLAGCERTRASRTPEEPTHDAHGLRWWTKTPACPAGAVLAGAAPPKSDLVWCEAAGVQDGPSTSFYPDGSRKSDATYRAGELDGPWKQYFHGGKPRTEGMFAKGKETGTWKVWFATGGLASERVYTAANTVRIREFRPGGKKAREGTLVDGQKNGAWVEYTENGDALRQVWDHGRRVSGVDWIVGVRECDEYVEKYTRCAEAQKDPTQREQFRESLRYAVQGWRDALATSKPTDVAVQCKAASDSMKQAAPSMGCSW